jgi:WD40 repeat protein
MARATTVLDTLEQVKTREPEPPSRADPWLDRDLETICLKCLEKEPSKRYASAEALAEDLERWLAGEPIQARSIGLASRLWRWCRRNRLVAGLCGLAALLLVSVIIILLVSVYWIAQERTDALTQRDRAQIQETLAQERERSVRRHLYVADMKLVQQAWHLGQIESMRQLVSRHFPDPEQEDLRGFEWYYLWRLCHPEHVALQGHERDVYCVAFSPDGKTLATASKDGTARLWDRATGQVRAILRGHIGEVNSVAFSPDGRLLATAGDDRTVQLWDMPMSGEIAASRVRLTGHQDEVSGVVFSPDSQTLVSASWDGKVKIWDVATARERGTLDGAIKRIYTLAISPSGRLLAIGGEDPAARLWDPVTREARGALGQVASTELRSVAFSRQGQLLATGTWETAVRVYQVPSGQEFRALAGHAGVESVAFSPDDRTLATADGEGTVRLWDILGDKISYAFQGHSDRLWCVAFSPDGQTLATAGEHPTVMLWPLERTMERRSLARPGKAINSLAFSPDGRILATGMADGTVELRDSSTGRLRRELRGHRAVVDSQAFSADGRILVSASADGTVRLWNPTTGELQGQLSPLAEGPRRVTISPDNQTLAMGERTGVRLYDLGSR